MTDVTAPKTFEEKMKDRIKDGIGDLLSDEDLSKMIKRSMEEVFFTEKKVYNSYGPDKTYPALLHSIVKEVMADQVKAEVKIWIDAHQAEMNTALATVMQEGVGMAVIAAVSQTFSAQLGTFEMNVRNQLMQPR